MITQRTKVQLLIFVIISLLGVTFVGARYAQLDRLFMDTTYKVTAHFPDSGGAFEGAEVTYRGVTIGQVSAMKLTDGGIDMVLDIEDGFDDIPRNSRALVGSRSAVGEQYVELQPQSDGQPFFADGDEIPRDMTSIPIPTTKLLTDLVTTVDSVDKEDLRIVVNEAGAAFEGVGPDLGTIIETSSSFIQTANDNFDVTRALINTSDTVLTTQIDKRSAIRSFSNDLAAFSTTLANSDDDLRQVINNGSTSTKRLRVFLENNRDDLGQLINNLVTTGRVVVRNIDGLEQALVIYPYVVAGGFTVVAPDPQTGNQDAHFGLVINETSPVCERGYDENVRSPQQRADIPMDMNARCAEPAGQSNPRGSQNAPRAGFGAEESPVIGSFDRETGELSMGGDMPAGTPRSVPVDDRTALQNLLSWPVGQ